MFELKIDVKQDHPIDMTYIQAAQKFMGHSRMALKKFIFYSN